MDILPINRNANTPPPGLDLTALTLLSNLPYYYLLNAFYTAHDYAVLPALATDLLSIALPCPIIALLVFTRRADIMGPFANRPATNAAALGATLAILALNTLLLLQAAGLALPGLG